MKSDDNIAVSIQQVSKQFRKTKSQKTLKSVFVQGFSKSSEAAEFEVLKDISIDIKEGEFFGIVGKNGGGKSTLLKLIAQIYRPSSGQVSIHGKLVPFIELGVGFNPELTGKENVYLNGALLGFSTKEVDKFYNQIVEFSELEGFMDEKLKNFSSGMQVRLAFAVAIKAEADILLIDEVLAVGDLKFQRKCFEHFRDLKRSKTTVVFVTHDMEAVREYCDRAALISQGKVKVVGSAEKIAQEYTKLQSANSGVHKSKNSRKSWGDLQAVLEKPNLDITPKRVSFVINAKAKTDLDGVVCGIRLKNSNGSYLFGGNTKNLGIKSPPIKKGKKTKICWAFENILTDGEYAIDVALHHLDGKSVHEWWDNAIEFRIEKGTNSIYPIDPEFNVEFV